MTLRHEYIVGTNTDSREIHSVHRQTIHKEESGEMSVSLSSSSLSRYQESRDLPVACSVCRVPQTPVVEGTAGHS